MSTKALTRPKAPRSPVAGIAVTAPRVLSHLDGRLSHLLAAKHAAVAALAKSTLELDQFLAACDVIIEEANNRPVMRSRLPPKVLNCVQEIQRKAEQPFMVPARSGA